MAGPDRLDVARLMQSFAPDARRLASALGTFADREDLGFVWLAHREDALVGCCSVGYTIGTTAGGIVAVVRDLYVTPAARRTGVASALLDSLAGRLAAADVVAIELRTGDDPDLAAFAAARGLSAGGGTFTAYR